MTNAPLIYKDDPNLWIVGSSPTMTMKRRGGDFALPLQKLQLKQQL